MLHQDELNKIIDIHKQESNLQNQQIEMLMKEIQTMKEDSAKIFKAKIDKKLKKKQKKIK